MLSTGFPSDLLGLGLCATWYCVYMVNEMGEKSFVLKDRKEILLDL